MNLEDELNIYYQIMRNQRDKLLQNTDKYLLPDYPSTLQQQMEIKTYRQALRDLPENNFILPTPPGFITK